MKNELICPNCKEAFKVDETGFASLLKQVRDQQFEDEIQSRLKLAEIEKENAIKLVEANLKNEFQSSLNKKENELSLLKAQSNTLLIEKLALKERELSDHLLLKENKISELNSKVEKANLELQITVTNALQNIEKERDTLLNELKLKATEQELLKKSI